MRGKCIASGEDAQGAWTCEKQNVYDATELCKSHYEQQRAGKELRRLNVCNKPILHDPNDLFGGSCERGHQGCTAPDGCGKIKPLSEFGADARRKNGKRTLCKSCRAKQNRKYRFCPDAPAYYEKVLAEQGGKCAIPSCNAHVNDGGKMCLDHNHAISEDGSDPDSLRGVLCVNCNRKLGIIERYLNDPSDFNAYLGIDILISRRNSV